MSENLRKIILCADDYGLTRPVNAAIRELIAARRINATSVMVVTPGFDAAEVEALAALRANAQIGLHVTLTAPFAPIAPNFTPLRDGRFFPVAETLRMATARRYRPAAVEAEVAAQVQKFTTAFGQPPDYLDGHQHVQLFPQIRDAFLKVAAELAPRAWVRQCGRIAPLHKKWSDPKGLLLDILSIGFRRKAARLGIVTNPGFAGSYTFNDTASFSQLFPSFLDGLPDGGLVMCHPGVVDAQLERLDPLTTLRERELAYFRSERFLETLATKGVTLA